MTESARLPRFAREALEGEAGSSQAGSSELEFERGLLSLEGAITADAVRHAPKGDAGPVGSADAQLADAAFNRLFERLEGTVGKAPYRYAPFFSRAAELFDLSE